MTTHRLVSEDAICELCDVPVVPGLPHATVTRSAVEDALGFLSRPDREHILYRLGYTDADVAAYHRRR